MIKIKLLNLFLALIIFSSIALAAPSLTIQPEISLTTFIGVEKTHYINISNPTNEIAYNVSFTNIPGFTFTSREIPGNTTINYEFKTKTNSSFSETYYSTMSFLYLENITSTPKTHNITLSSTGISPNSIAIKKGDTISWFNSNPTQTLTVTGESSTWSITVLPLNHSEKTFNNIENISYSCKISGTTYGADIFVESNLIEDKIHNSAYDKTLKINLNSTFAPTTISLEIFIDSFNLEYNEAGLGVGRITNNGEFTALDLFISMPWAVFENNSFNLEKEKSKIINFAISPEITKTSDTNKTYIKELTLSGTNIGVIKKNISIFVKYKKINESETQGTYTMDEVRKMLEEMLRLAGNETQNTTTIIYRDKPVYYNFTQEEVSNMDDRLISLEGKGDRTYNLYKQESDKVKEDIESIKGDSQETRDNVDAKLKEMKNLAENSTSALDSIAQEFKEQQERDLRAKRIKSIWSWIKGIGGILVIISLGITFFLIKFKKNKIKDLT